MSNNLNGNTVKIDGKIVEITEGATVLQTARKAGIYIPTLCYLENIESYGGCRLCMVEIKNMKGFPTACTTPVVPGMEISTKTPELQSLRRDIMELILTEHPYTCLVCKDKNECGEYMHTTRKVSVTTGCNFCTNNGDCELQDMVEYLELKEIRFPVSYRNVKPVLNNPFYKIDYNLCVLCGRCVRICNEERNSGVLAFIKRGNDSLVGTAFKESQMEAGCEYCGACVDVCPTGSLSEKIGRWAGVPDKSTETICPFCEVGCKMNVNTKNDKIVNVGPKPGKRIETIQLCVCGKFVPPDIMNHPERITKPMFRKGDKWIETDWENVIKYTADKLNNFRGDQFAFIGSAHDSLENNYVYQKFTRIAMRSNNVELLNSYPDKNLIKKIRNFNSGYPPANIDDISNADTIFLIGTQANISHPMLENRIRKAFRNGKEIIYANTHYTRTSDFASQNIFYSPGHEMNFLLLLLSELAKGSNRKINKECREELKKFDLNNPETLCGISPKETKNAARSLKKSEQPLIIVGDGIFRNSESASLYNAVLNIHLLLNRKNNCRILFLLDEGNRYGSTLVGMYPDENINSYEIIKTISKEEIKALFLVGDIPAHSALSGLKFLVQQNMFLTETSKFADVFLPLPGFTETDGHILNSRQELKKMNNVHSPPENVKHGWEIIRDIAEEMSEVAFRYKSLSEIFEEINNCIDFSFSGSKNDRHNLFPLEIAKHQETPGFPVTLILEPNYFNYMGNNLSSKIRDLKIIREEDALFISPEISSGLGVVNGDKVLLSTKYGASEMTVKINPDLTAQTAYFKPSYENIFLFTDGLTINRSFIPSKIERI